VNNTVRIFEEAFTRLNRFTKCTPLVKLEKETGEPHAGPCRAEPSDADGHEVLRRHLLPLKRIILGIFPNGDMLGAGRLVPNSDMLGAGGRARGSLTVICSERVGRLGVPNGDMLGAGERTDVRGGTFFR
jgi:hypothetical protein